MAGVKDAIESGHLNAKLLDICPGFSGVEKENCKMVYTIDRHCKLLLATCECKLQLAECKLQKMKVAS